MRRLTPQEKKRLEYDRDRFAEVEHPHLFRTGWPRKKARVTRRDRRRAERLLEGLRNRPAGEVVERADDAALTAAHVRDSVATRALWKTGVLTLRERVAHRQEARVEKIGRNFFKHPYDSAAHRGPFAAFLASLVAGRAEGSRAAALHLATLLDPRPRDPVTDHWRAMRRVWLSAFFRDEPAWEPRLRAWIGRMTSAEDR